MTFIQRETFILFSKPGNRREEALRSYLYGVWRLYQENIGGEHFPVLLGPKAVSRRTGTEARRLMREGHNVVVQKRARISPPSIILEHYRDD